MIFKCKQSLPSRPLGARGAIAPPKKKLGVHSTSSNFWSAPPPPPPLVVTGPFKNCLHTCQLNRSSTPAWKWGFLFFLLVSSAQHPYSIPLGSEDLFFSFFACQLSSAPLQHPCLEGRTLCFVFSSFFACQLRSSTIAARLIGRWGPFYWSCFACQHSAPSVKKSFPCRALLLSKWHLQMHTVHGNVNILDTFLCFYTVEPGYNEDLGTMKITLLYQVSHIRVKKQRNIKSWDQLNHLVITGFCYIRPLYKEVPLYQFFFIFALFFVGILWSSGVRLQIKSLSSTNDSHRHTQDCALYCFTYVVINVLDWCAPCVEDGIIVPMIDDHYPTGS